MKNPLDRRRFLATSAAAGAALAADDNLGGRPGQAGPAGRRAGPPRAVPGLAAGSTSATRRTCSTSCTAASGSAAAASA